MVEKETVYSTKAKYGGVFNFKDFYAFCFKWLTEEIDLDVSEDEYSEKISGSLKEVAFKWTGEKKVTDYFKFQVKVEVLILAMSDVEVNQGGKKIKSNKGDVEIKTKGILMRDYDGKFETSGKMKFWRAIYEKWIIPSRVKEFEDTLVKKCDEFLGQAKAFLALEGKR